MTVAHRAFFALLALLAAIAISPVRSMSEARYLGQPDLPVTAAVVQAGGGATNFDSTKLLGVLFDNDQQTLAAFTTKYGAQRVTQFAQTFNYAIDDALRVATNAGVKLPDPPADLTTNGSALCAALVHDGTMPDGRFDIGYLIEHLLSRQVHIAIMHDMNADQSIGTQKNADFHVLFTDVLNGCKAKYKL
ncbi:MAG: hypothetical protein ACXVAK_12255 [Vulcanimicrobiaceae bacterium]